MGDFQPLRGRGKGGRVPILSHPYGGILSHFSDNVTGGYRYHDYKIADYYPLYSIFQAFFYSVIQVSKVFTCS